jgi:hypothetical protein
MLQWDAFEPTFLRYVVGSMDDRVCSSFTGSALSSILLAILPISAAVRGQRERAAGEKGGERAIGRIITILGCIALVCMLLIVPISETHHLWMSHGGTAPAKAIGIVAISIISAIVGLASLLSVFGSNARHTASMVLIFLLATWIVPLVADVIEHSVLLDDYDAQRTPWSITAFGPIGTMTSPWIPEVQTPAGIYCQVSVAVAMAGLAALAARNRRRRKSSAQLAASPAPAPELPAVANSTL